VTASGAQPNQRVGQIAGIGPRFLAYLVDGIIADVLAAIVNGGYHRDSRQNILNLGIFVLIQVFFIAFAGQTPGMRVVGIGVLRKDRQRRLAFRWTLLRTALAVIVIPAVVIDQSGLGMHDRAAGSVILHTR
jgi:uncharacterized RDD family membrane protein YckC